MILFFGIVKSIFFITNIQRNSSNIAHRHINITKDTMYMSSYSYTIRMSNDFSQATDWVLEEPSNNDNQTMIKDKWANKYFYQFISKVILRTKAWYRGSPRKYKLVLLPDNTFVITTTGGFLFSEGLFKSSKCIVHDSSNNRLRVRSCDNNSTRFNLFFEAQVIKVKYSLFKKLGIIREESDNNDLNMMNSNFYNYNDKSIGYSTNDVYSPHGPNYNFFYNSNYDIADNNNSYDHFKYDNYLLENANRSSHISAKDRYIKYKLAPYSRSPEHIPHFVFT